MTLQRPFERLTAAPRRLSAKGVRIGYRALRDMAVDGLFPAHQINSIWHYYVPDLGLIAEATQKRLPCTTDFAA